MRLNPTEALLQNDTIRSFAFDAPGARASARSILSAHFGIDPRADVKKTGPDFELAQRMLIGLACFMPMEYCIP